MQLFILDISRDAAKYGRSLTGAAAGPSPGAGACICEVRREVSAGARRGWITDAQAGQLAGSKLAFPTVAIKIKTCHRYIKVLRS